MRPKFLLRRMKRRRRRCCPGRMRKSHNQTATWVLLILYSMLERYEDCLKRKKNDAKKKSLSNVSKWIKKFSTFVEFVQIPPIGCIANEKNFTPRRKPWLNIISSFCSDNLKQGKRFINKKKKKKQICRISDILFAPFQLGANHFRVNSPSKFLYHPKAESIFISFKFFKSEETNNFTIFGWFHCIHIKVIPSLETFGDA